MSDPLEIRLLGPFEVNGRAYSLPKFTFVDTKSADPIRIGLFGGIHGAAPAGEARGVERID